MALQPRVAGGRLAPHAIAVGLGGGGESQVGVGRGHGRLSCFQANVKGKVILPERIGSVKSIDNISSLTTVGRGVELVDNFYASVTGNVLTRVRTGIQTNNFNLANPGPAAVIDGNTVTFYVRGVFDNLQYQSASPWTITDNTLTYLPLAATADYNGGLFVFSIQDGASATIQNNNVIGAKYGVELWNDPTTATITVKGGILTNNQVGVWATNNDPNYGAGAATTAVLDGVTITGSTADGVLIEDQAAGTSTIGLTVQKSAITGGPVGVEVKGGRSAFVLTDDTITNDSTGVRLDADAVATAADSIHGVNFSGDTTAGVRHDGGGTLDATNNFWGAVTGPTHPVNSGGAGVNVIDSRNGAAGSGIVNFAPFLTTPIDTTAFQVTAMPSVLDFGQTFIVTVTALRPAALGGGVNTGYAGTIMLSGAGLVSGLPASFTFGASELGTKTFTVTAAAAGSGAVTVFDASSSAISGAASILVRQGPNTALTPMPVVAHAFSPLQNVVVATFTHGAGGIAAALFGATINWGDGTTTAGVVSEAGGVYSVLGSHTYQDEGVFGVTVTVTSPDGAPPASGATTADVHAELLPDGTVGTPDQRFVLALYRNLLGRGVSLAEFQNGNVNAWVQFLAGHSRVQTVALFEKAPEYLQKEVRDLYQHYLHRDADPVGLQSAVAFLQQNGTVEQVAAMLVSSPEYAALHGGGAAALAALYQDAFGRPIDPGALANGLSLLNQGTSFAQVAQGVLASPEYRADLTFSYYQRFLHRNPEPAAVQAGVALLATGAPDETLIANIVGDAVFSEFYNRVTR
jgi:hypothetical protein